MNSRQLIYFIAVAEELHFGRAAERLDIAQPPLSRQIKQLETELGAVLFQRGPGGVSLTQAGRRLFERASLILDQIEDTEREIRRIGQGMEGRLRIGYVGSAVFGVLPPIVKAFRASFPDIFLSLAPLNNAALKRALIRREIDIAITRRNLTDAEIMSRPLTVEPLALAAPEGLFPPGAVLGPADVSGRTFILFPEYPRPSFADVTLAAAQTSGIDTARHVFTMDVNTALGLTSVGEGVTIIPASVGQVARLGVSFHTFDPSIGVTGVSINHRLDDQSIHVHNFGEIARVVSRRLQSAEIQDGLSGI